MCGVGICGNGSGGGGGAVCDECGCVDGVCGVCGGDVCGGGGACSGSDVRCGKGGDSFSGNGYHIVMIIMIKKEIRWLLLTKVVEVALKIN